MKKNFDFSCLVMAVFISFTICGTFASCADDRKFEIDSCNKGLRLSPNRTIDEALIIAENAKGMFADQSSTRSGHARVVDKESVRVICGNKTRSNSSNILDTLIYVVNYAHDEGFAIISANLGTEALLGVTEMGNYDDAIAKVDGFSLYMDLAKKYVKQVSRFNGDPFVEIETTLIDSLNPLITVKWGQKFPEGLYCPNTIAGCANTAAIQVCSYYEYPTSINLTFSQRERDSVNINWTEVKNHQKGCSSYISHTNCTASENSHKVIAELARQCGVYSDSRYKHNGVVLSNDAPAPYSYNNYCSWSSASTSTYLADIIDMFETLGYVRPQVYSYSSLQTRFPLSLGRLICMVGESLTSGHIWVVDGFKYYHDVITNHATEPATVTDSDRYYNHVNWGWNGISNGYFLDGVFTANAAYSYDDESLGIASNSYSDIEYFTIKM